MNIRNAAHVGGFATFGVVLLVASACGTSTASTASTKPATTKVVTKATKTSAKKLPTNQASTPTTIRKMTDKEHALAFAKCMRENGVDFPDPGASGALVGMDPGSASFDTAFAKCRTLVGPGSSNGTRTGMPPELKSQFLAIAKCMRANGYPDYPDPQFDTAKGGVIDMSDSDANNPAKTEQMRKCSEDALKKIMAAVTR